jgi:hypothetical protein
MRPRADPRAAWLWLAATSLALAAIGVALYKAWPLLYPQTAERAALNPDCDLRRAPCTVVFESGAAVRLDIQPRGIPLLRPLDIQVRIDALPAARQVEVDFAGLDMGMGYNRVALHALGSPTDPTAGQAADRAESQSARQSGQQSGVYTGSGMLPSCVRERMTWEARVLIYLADGILAAPFRFETRR